MGLHCYVLTFGLILNTNQMKKLIIPCLFFCIGLLFAPVVVKAQADSFDADIVKMQQLNGSGDAMFSQIVMQFKSVKPFYSFSN